MNNSFIAECRELISSMPERTGDNARLAFRLAIAIDRIENLKKMAESQRLQGFDGLTLSPLSVSWLDQPLRG